MLVPTHTHRRLFCRCSQTSPFTSGRWRLIELDADWMSPEKFYFSRHILPQTLFRPVKPVKTCLSGVSNIFIIVSSSVLFYFQSGFWWFTVRRGRSINVLFKLWYSSIGQQNLWPLKTYNHRGTCSGESTKEKKEMMDRGVCMRSVKCSFLSLCVFYSQESVPHRRQGDLLWEEVCVSAVLILSEQRQARQGPRAEL